MPEYLAPGVFVEEVSYRSKSIEGVSTTTTGFIGPVRYGPVDLEPDIITSLGEFERTYGDRQQLKFKANDGVTPLEPMHNYLWHAVRAFFEEGGKRLYISRVFKPISGTDDGCAGIWLPMQKQKILDAQKAGSIRIKARFPGEMGSMRVRLTLRMGQNALSSEPVTGPEKIKRTVRSLLDGDLVRISYSHTSSPFSPPGPEGYYIAESYPDSATKETTWRFKDPTMSPPRTIELKSLNPDPNPEHSDKVRVVTLTVTVMPIGESDLPPTVYDGIALHPGHKRAGESDSIFDRLAAKPGNISLQRNLPIVIERGANIKDGIDTLNILFSSDPNLQNKLEDLSSTDADRSVNAILEGGNDGQRPEAAEYEGRADETEKTKTGLKSFEDIEDISIVAAPGSTFGYENGYRNEAATIINQLSSHAERMRYRIAVLDCGDEQSMSQVRAMRSRIDSKHAAFYYPWIRILDPVTRQEISLPPSGSVAGIYARNDTIRAVYKAPANEVVNLAIGFEQLLNKSQQEVLNPEGINCFRFFEGRGFRLWGARTTSSDPEWKYVNLRRYFAYLERSIDKGTQWAVFEPNGDALWANVKRTIEDFLLNEWQSGALLGDKPEKAYFVKCDRSTMTQNDLDNGRLIVQIGVAPLRPAEFVIFRIGQWTADRRS